ncbi:MAG TPA: UDP-N-acetylmuramoyl-tripeptide--D-alanyl-D-alanine ligase [Patescibacteria group bacterium]
MVKTILFRMYTGILAWEASIFRNRYQGPVIAITGSAGKTSTKEILGKLVRKAYGENVFVTPKSLNAEIGVPLTVLGFKEEPRGLIAWCMAPLQGAMTAFLGKVPECMVIEVGAEHKGDIARFSRLIRPTHAIITNISQVHSAYFGSLEELKKEKLSLLHFVDPKGVIILNGDDDSLNKVMIQPTQEKILIRIERRADYFVSGVKVTLQGTQAVLHHHNRTQRIHIARYGEQHMYGVMFAAALGDNLGISPAVQLQTFKEIRPLPGRGMLIEGKRQSIIIDESYNADPLAMRGSLELLRQLPASKRVAILGDMRELITPDPIHREIGAFARQCADYVIGVGPLSKLYKPDEWFMTSPEAVASALRQLGPDVIVLVKGSQNTIRLEKLVKELMRSPEQASKLLVRQGPEWNHRP